MAAHKPIHVNKRLEKFLSPAEKQVIALSSGPLALSTSFESRIQQQQQHHHHHHPHPPVNTGSVRRETLEDMASSTSSAHGGGAEGNVSTVSITAVEHKSIKERIDLFEHKFMHTVAAKKDRRQSDVFSTSAPLFRRQDMEAVVMEASAELLEKIAQTETRAVEAERELKERVAQVEESHVLSEESARRLKESEEKCEALAREFETFRAAIEKETGALHGEASAAKLRLKDMQHEYEAHVDRLEAELKGLGKEVEERDAQIAKLKQNGENLIQRCQTLSQQKADADHKVEDLNNTIKQFKNAILEQRQTEANKAIPVNGAATAAAASTNTNKKMLSFLIGMRPLRPKVNPNQAIPAQVDNEKRLSSRLDVTALHRITEEKNAELTREVASLKKQLQEADARIQALVVSQFAAALGGAITEEGERERALLEVSLAESVEKASSSPQQQRRQAVVGGDNTNMMDSMLDFSRIGA